MMKFSKLGAAALGVALSITMLAPMTANASTIKTWDAEGNTTFTNEDTGKRAVAIM